MIQDLEGMKTGDKFEGKERDREERKERKEDGGGRKEFKHDSRRALRR